MKNGISYKIWVIWMNDDFFWASQCLEHISKIYQLSLVGLSRWVLFNLCEWYSHLHWWVFASASELCTKSITMTLRSWLTDWHWQMWVCSQVNQVSKVYSESWKECTNEPSENEDNHELTSL